jgi:bacteriorhodopsin
LKIDCVHIKVARRLISGECLLQREAQLDENTLIRIVVMVVSLAMIIAGTTIVLRMQPTDPMRQYALVILALTFLAPLILLLSYLGLIPKDGTTAIVGGMTAYFFTATRPTGFAAADKSG